MQIEKNAKKVKKSLKKFTILKFQCIINYRVESPPAIVRASSQVLWQKFPFDKEY